MVKDLSFVQAEAHLTGAAIAQATSPSTSIAPSPKPAWAIKT